MTMIDPILMEFEQESATTRRVLSCVPTEKLDWRPHPKARSLGELSTHIAVSQKAVTSAIQKPTHELLQLKETVPEKSEGIVAMFDENIVEAKRLLGAMSDDDLLSKWQGMAGGKTVFSAPKIAVVRAILLNHTYHHRGQLSAYLRQLDVKLPSIYGPSADENPFM